MQLTATVQVQEKITEKDAYRLIVFDPAGTAILLELQGKECRLPGIEVPKFTRPAQEVTQLLQASWGMSSVFLFSGVLEEAPETSYFAVLESTEGFRAHPADMEWFTIHHALSNLLFHAQERRTVKSSYRKAVSRILVDPRQPFCRLGWMREVEDWTRNLLQPHGMDLKGFEQLNGCETFSLIRFITTQRPVWFKAVGEPNLHEYEITQALARMLPSYIPEVLDTKAEWHAWIMFDGGATLDEVQEPSAWQLALSSFADLQIESSGVAENLLEAGCRDLRLAKLVDLVDPFLDVMANLMRQQTKVPPPVLSEEELARLGVTIKNALYCLGALRIPDTLGHSDFNPGNILVDSSRCTFIDWAEAYVGHPFLTFEYFLAHLRKGYSGLVPFEGNLRATYAKRWQAVSSPEVVTEAFLLSPLAAIFAYAVAGSIWRDTERLKIPQVSGYLRSLTRLMKQEADLLQRRRVECPN